MKPAITLWFVLAALQSPPPDPLAAARKAEAAGDFQAAEKLYVQVLASRKDWEIYQRLGLVRHLQNKFPEAIPAFEEALRLNPDAWGSSLFLGIDLYRTNRFSAALKALERSAKLQPENPEVRFWLGATYIALKRYLDGQVILEELAAQQPKNLEILRLLAQSYSDYAVELHNRVVAEHPDSAWAFLVHGQALENEGHCDAAIAEYRKAQTRKPGIQGVEEAIARCRARR